MPEAITSPEAGESRSGLDKGFTLFDLAIVLAKRKKLVLGLPLLAGSIAVVVALSIPNVYTSTARILPPQQKDSSGSVLVGALGGAGAPVSQVLGLRNANELYVGVLKSRTIADRLIERFNLRALYRATTMSGARNALAARTKIAAGKDGLIAIDVEDEVPQRAADLANAYVAELDRLMQTLAVSEASQRRLFFEKQLANARSELVAAEVALRQAIETKGIVGVDAQSRGLLGTTEQLRAQIAVKEIQLNAMRAFATERNPDSARLRQEIASMRGELANLEGGRGQANGGISPPGLENVLKLRETKFRELTVELLTKQYEIAKIDEAKDAVLIQVVDKAIPADYKSKPKRSAIVLLAIASVGFFSIIAALIQESLMKMREDPQSANRLHRLRQYLGWRSRR